MPRRLVIFVPGIMGSVLHFRGAGPLGDPVDDEVWGPDPSRVLDTLARRPGRLGSPHLQVIEVLREVKGKVYGTWVHQIVYGSLLDFCVEKVETGGLGLEPETEFVPFPYDWRQDNRDSAKRLADRIEQIDPHGDRPIGLVAHSMGGLICRLLLLANQEIKSRIRFFLQIASPILGSPKAFRTLREGPAFSLLMDWVIGGMYRVDPQVKVDLITALRTFPSMYQLLPPEGDLMLITPTGAKLSAVAQEVWPSDHRCHLDAAREVHRMLTTPCSVPVKCIYANDHKTAWFYKVNDEFRITGSREDEFGDGTVLSASAFEGTEVVNRLRVDHGKTEHDELPYNAAVKEELRSLLGKMSV